jgi:hypothetical protein
VVNFAIKENPTTGYQLIVDNSTIQAVFLYDSRYEAYKNYLKNNVVGAGGTRIF